MQAAAALYPPTIVPPRVPLPLHRFLPAFIRNPLRSLPQGVYDGDYVVVRPTERFAIAWIADPHLTEHILVARADEFQKSPVERRVFGPSLQDGVLTADGALWRWQRKAMAPLFRPVDILAMVPEMVAATEAELSRWSDRTHVRDVERDMTLATFEIIVRTMLGGLPTADALRLTRATEDYLANISWEMAWGLLRLPTWLPHPATWQIRRAARVSREAVARLIVARRVTPRAGRPDLLARLLDARDPETGEPMAEDRVVSNLLTLLNAGHETTAKALTWTLYLLARAPLWQDAVRAEVERVAPGRPVTGDDIAQLAVTTRVLKEAMRLYPPAPVIAREPVHDVTLGGHLQLPAGSQIIIPMFAVHRHRAYWHDPDRFDPDRFLPEREKSIYRTQYMPFGAGPRVCLGQSFAMVEAAAVLATLLRRSRFVWDGRHLPEPLSRVTLRPKGGMPLKVERIVR